MEKIFFCQPEFLPKKALNAQHTEQRGYRGGRSEDSLYEGFTVAAVSLIYYRSFPMFYEKLNTDSP